MGVWLVGLEVETYVSAMVESTVEANEQHLSGFCLLIKRAVPALAWLCHENSEALDKITQ